MTPSDLFATLETIKSNFPHLKKRLDESPLLLEEWSRALKPCDPDNAVQALRRWVRSEQREPTLERFMSLMDDIAEDMCRTMANNRPSSDPESLAGPILEALTETQMKQKSEDDALWAALNIELTLKLLESSENPEAKARMRSAFYAEIAREYPQFAAESMLHI